jgi:hypothetical protein
MFSDVQLEKLRHAFVQLCGSDDTEAGLPTGKLKELAVLAELDITDAQTLDVVAKLVRALPGVFGFEISPRAFPSITYASRHGADAS